MMGTKMMASGGMMKKGYAAGGAVKKKPKSGAMEMVMKNGKKVPAFAADGVGKMAKGGMAKSKMTATGGVKSKMGMSGGASKRADGVASKGKTKTKMV